MVIYKGTAEMNVYVTLNTSFFMLTLSVVYCNRFSIHTDRKKRRHQFDDKWIMKNGVDNRSGVSSIAACAVWCTTSPGCQSFSFHETSHCCQLYSWANFDVTAVTTIPSPGTAYCGSLLVWRTTNYWIGLSDETVANGVFIWSDGTRASYTNWIPGEGSNAAEFCVEMVRSQDYKWNDNPCWAPLRFICEYTPNIV